MSGAFSCSSAVPILDSPGTGAFFDRRRVAVPCQVASSSWVFSSSRASISVMSAIFLRSGVGSMPLAVL